jgi:hypothetical protein
MRLRSGRAFSHIFFLGWLQLEMATLHLRIKKDRLEVCACFSAGTDFQSVPSCAEGQTRSLSPLALKDRLEVCPRFAASITRSNEASSSVGIG